MTESDSVVYLALIAAASGFLSPIFLSVLHNRQLKAKEARDYKRQDEVASRVAALQVQTEKSAGEVQKQLVVIHTLVNSKFTLVNAKLTQEMQERLVALDALLALNVVAGTDSTEAGLETLRKLEQSAEALRREISERTPEV